MRAVIRPRLWLRVAGLAAALLTVASGAAGAVTARLSELSRALVASRSDANFRALRNFADAASGRDRALAYYAIGMAHYRAKDYPAAESALARLGAADGWVAEYAAYYRARCIVLAEEFERSLAPLSAFVKLFPDSRFRPAAGRLRVESLLRLKRLDDARALLVAGSSELEEPVRLYLSGRAEHLDGKLERAVSLYREAYYFYPSSDQARVAEQQLDRLRAGMGNAYPEAPADCPRRQRARRERKGNAAVDQADVVGAVAEPQQVQVEQHCYEAEVAEPHDTHGEQVPVHVGVEGAKRLAKVGHGAPDSGLGTATVRRSASGGP